MKANKMKVKVVFGQSRLVVPCGNVTDKVERLIEDINRRFQSHLGDPTARAKELLTADGFLLNAHDLIEDVIDDGSALNALDFPTWLKLHVPLLEKGGHKVSRTDHAEGNPRTAPARYAEIGKHKHNKIYVKIGGAATEVDKLELFDAESLRTFGEKEGRALVAHKTVKDDKWDWSVEIHFIIAAGVVTAAELSVKATSDARAHVEVVPIKVDGLVLGEPKVVQTASFGKPDKAYAIPAPVREGPAYVPGKDFLPRDQEPEGIVESPVPENNLAVGDLGLEIKQKDACQPDQGWRESDGYWNKFYNNLAIFNPLEKEIALTKISSAYEKDGQWIEMTTSLGYKQGYYNYQFGARHDGFALEPNARLNLAINSAVKVNARQFDRERRAHGSLPSPLRIRISFEDKEGKKAEIVIEHRNQPLYLSTKESRAAQLKQPVAFFVSADDTDAEGNVWTQAVEVPDEKRVEFSSRGSNSTTYVTKTLLDKILFEAKKDGKTELPMPNLSTVNKENGFAINATALVDLENQWVYAIRFEITTNTSRAVDHYVLPDIF